MMGTRCSRSLEFRETGMAKPKRPAAKKRKAPKPKTPPRAAKSRKPPAPKRAAPKRGVHDLGGLPAGPIDRSPHAPTPFEERVDALMMVLTNQHGLSKVDSFRRTIEGLDKRAYNHMAYYEKWIYGIRSMLVEQGVLTDAEIDAKIAEIRKRVARGPAA
jgi:hypothetical protein